MLAYTRSHPTFAPRPQIWSIYLSEGCALAGDEITIFFRWDDLEMFQKVIDFFQRAVLWLGDEITIFFVGVIGESLEGCDFLRR